MGGGCLLRQNFCRIYFYEGKFLQHFYYYPLLEKIGLCYTYENLLEILILQFTIVIVLEYNWLVKRIYLTELKDQITVVSQSADVWYLT